MLCTYVLVGLAPAVHSLYNYDAKSVQFSPYVSLQKQTFLLIGYRIILLTIEAVNVFFIINLINGESQHRLEVLIVSDVFEIP